MMSRTKSIFQNQLVFVITALFCTFLWGSAFPCIHIGYDLFRIAGNDTPSQILFAGTRFVLAGVLTILAGSLIQKKILIPDKKSIKYITCLSAFQTVGQYILFYIGLAHISSVNASILEGSCLFFTVLVACYVFRCEKMTWAKAVGCILGFAGVVLVNLNGTGVSFTFRLTGEGFILLSAVCSAVSSSLIKLFSKHENTVLLSGYQFLLGGLFMMLCGILSGGHIENAGIRGILLLIYLAFISACAYTLWGLLLKYNPVGKVSIFSTFNPVFGVILSILLLKDSEEHFGASGLAALLLVICGIIIINKFEKGEEHGKTKLEAR